MTAGDQEQLLTVQLNLNMTQGHQEHRPFDSSQDWDTVDASSPGKATGAEVNPSD